MFRGRTVHTIDPKGRLSIPAGYRVELQEKAKQAPILTNLKDCLGLYPAADWALIEQQLGEASPVQPEVQAMARFLISGAEDAEIDKQGRIRIPALLREHAGLEREVVVAGVGPRIELWDKARFDQELNRTLARYDEISAVVAQSHTPGRSHGGPGGGDSSG